MLRFVSNAKRVCVNDNEDSELLPEQLGATEEQIIKMAQLESFPDAIKALQSNKPIPKKNLLLPINSMLIARLLRSNTRLRKAEDLSNDVKLVMVMVVVPFGTNPKTIH